MDTGKCDLEVAFFKANSQPRSQGHSSYHPLERAMGW